MKDKGLFVLLFATAVLLMSSCASRRTTLQNPNYRKHSNVRPSGTTSSTGLAYIERYKDIAIKEMNQYGVPASITLAQALLESGNGNSYLAREANNHFGIKCGSTWRGKSVSRPDDHARDCFRVYDNPEESFRDHSEFLLKQRYEKLFRLNKDDYKGWAKGLREAGYATNPRYPQLLIDLIERYQLYQYDHAELSYAMKEERAEKVEEIIVEKELEAPEVKRNTMDDTKPAEAMLIYEVKPGDTLSKISREHGVPVEQIRQRNALSSDELSEGQLLLLSK